MNSVFYISLPKNTIVLSALFQSISHPSRCGVAIHPHPNLHRRLSVRECARIQSFPDDFIFYGSKGAAYAQIGNAVPPLMSFHIANEFRKAFDLKPKKFTAKEWNLPYIT